MLTAEEIAVQRHRWLSMHHVGEAKPVVRAFVRKGHLERRYRRLPSSECFGFVPGLLTPNDVWYGEWVPDTAYQEIPNVKDAKGEQNYSENGVEQVTMTIDNIGMIQQTGNLGALFHMIERGYYSPQRGQRNNRGEAAGTKNEWFDVWKDKSTQIVILAGYGEAVFPLHVGLIDKTQLTSRPDQIVVSMRNMGQFLTDQDVFGDAKNLWVRDPITFADRVDVQQGPNVASSANTKSNKPGSKPAFATDEKSKTAWVSQGHSNPQEIEWIEFPLPASNLIKFEMFPAYTDMEMFVSIFTTNKGLPGDQKARFANGTVLGEGWVNLSQGHVPGTTIPFVNHVPGIRESMTTYPITSAGQKIISGDDTKVRLWFRNLQPSPTDSGKGITYRAGVRECRIRDVAVPDAAKRGHWILIDDVADMVRIVLQWVGIHDWEIEDTGVRLSDKVVFDRTKKLMDIINYIKEQVSYVFYVRPPDDFDINDLSPGNVTNKSMGVAVFRQSSAMKDNPPEAVESVKDTNLLTAVNAEFDAGQLPDSVRVRGKAVSDKIARNDPGHIHPLGADRTQRFQSSYRPVWARRNSKGQAHLRKPIVHYEPLIESLYECEVTCLLIAFRAALSSAKGSIEIPLWPRIHLDHQTLLLDEGTGMSTRIWNVQRSWQYVGGAEVEFKMNLSGSFIDINDVSETREELVSVLNEGGRMPSPIARGPWTEPHRF